MSKPFNVLNAQRLARGFSVSTFAKRRRANWARRVGALVAVVFVVGLALSLRAGVGR